MLYYWFNIICIGNANRLNVSDTKFQFDGFSIVSPARGTLHGWTIRYIGISLDRPSEIKGRKVNRIVNETQNYDSRAFS